MTTSYELSLRLKELGVPQEGGGYYWVEHWDGSIELLHKSQIQANTIKSILCRAITLGELVRMVQGISVMQFQDDTWFSYCDLSACFELQEHKTYSTPEEAAGELLAETLKQKKG